MQTGIVNNRSCKLECRESADNMAKDHKKAIKWKIFKFSEIKEENEIPDFTKIFKFWRKTAKALLFF